MRKFLKIFAVSAIIMVYTSSCDFNKNKISEEAGSSATEQQDNDKPTYNLDKCKTLLTAGEQKELSAEQISELIDQFDGLLTHIDTETNRIAKMPAGQEKCNAWGILKNSREVKAAALAYTILNTADKQKGFNNSVGQRIKALNANDRMKKITLKSDAIYSECKQP